MSKGITRAAVVLLFATGALGLAGCAGLSEGAGSMGAEDMEVWGYVASEEYAQLEVAESQPGVEELVVARVLAPEDAWIVVHLDDDGMPGERVGLVHVTEGESTDVRVTLEGVTTPNVIVAVHADRATNGEFDFDMMDARHSPDRPFFVNREELASVVTVR
jgi:hypothetical protein